MDITPNHGRCAIRAGGRLLASFVLIVCAGCSDHSAREGADHSSHHPDEGASPYASHVDRRIKALSAEETEALLAGEGMGMALAAELNGYPGPKHVLELSSRLGLERRQVQSVIMVFEAMKEEARRLGDRIVSDEAELDRAFATGRISREELERRVTEIGAARAELRAVHLRAHLDMMDVLSSEQVRRYRELRGYAP